MVDTEFLGVWDSDVVVPLEQFDNTLDTLRSGKADMVYTYDGRFYNVYGEVIQAFLDSKDEKMETVDQKYQII